MPYDIPRYKTCGYGHPIYNQEGEYDEVICGHSKEHNYCGDFLCPLDSQDIEEDR